MRISKQKFQNVLGPCRRTLCTSRGQEDPSSIPPRDQCSGALCGALTLQNKQTHGAADISKNKTLISLEARSDCWAMVEQASCESESATPALRSVTCPSTKTTDAEKQTPKLAGVYGDTCAITCLIFCSLIGFGARERLRRRTGETKSTQPAI